MSRNERLDLFVAIEKVLPWEDIVISVEEAKKLAKLDLLETKFNYLHKYTPTLLSALEFRATKSSEPFLKALEVIRDLNASVKRKVPEGAPLDFVSPDGRNKFLMKTETLTGIIMIWPNRKTIFILDYISSESMRRRIQKGLNKGEAMKKVPFGKDNNKDYAVLKGIDLPKGLNSQVCGESCVTKDSSGRRSARGFRTNACKPHYSFTVWIPKYRKVTKYQLF